MRHTQAQAVELRDTLVPGFLCKMTRRVRKVFMLQNHPFLREGLHPIL